MLPPGSEPDRAGGLDAAVAGLTTAEIARPTSCPSDDGAADQPSQTDPGRRRNVRPAPGIRALGAPRVVLEVLYLLFNEGYTAMSGPALLRPDLTTEAIRLAQEVHRIVPADGEVAGCWR